LCSLRGSRIIWWMQRTMIFFLLIWHEVQGIDFDYFELKRKAKIRNRISFWALCSAQLTNILKNFPLDNYSVLTCKWLGCSNCVVLYFVQNHTYYRFLSRKRLTLVTESLTFMAATVSFPCFESWYNLKLKSLNIKQSKQCQWF